MSIRPINLPNNVVAFSSETIRLIITPEAAAAAREALESMQNKRSSHTPDPHVSTPPTNLANSSIVPISRLEEGDSVGNSGLEKTDGEKQPKRPKFVSSAKAAAAARKALESLKALRSKDEKNVLLSIAQPGINSERPKFLVSAEAAAAARKALESQKALKSASEKKVSLSTDQPGVNAREQDLTYTERQNIDDQFSTTDIHQLD